MHNHKSLKSVIFILLLTVTIIFPGCGGTAPPINHSPVIFNLIASPSSIEVNQETTITCYATDSDGDALTYNWTKTGGTINGSGPSITWTAPAVEETYTITCNVSDGKGEEDSESVNIIVEPNEEGEISNVIHEFFQAISDQDWDTARSYCIYGSEVYENINEAEEQFYWDNLNSEGALDINYNESIGEIIINGEYAEAYVYVTVTTFINCEVIDLEEDDLSSWIYLYLQKIGNNWKLYSFGVPPVLPEEPPINQYPVITSDPLITATVGEVYTYDVEAIDSDGDTLIYSLTTSPEEMTINPATGIIDWFPAESGTFNVVVVVSNEHGQDTQSFNIIVSNPSLLGEDNENVVLEKCFYVYSEEGGTFNLSDGTIVEVPPYALSENSTLIIRKLEYDIGEKQVIITITPKSLYELNLLPGVGMLDSIDITVPMGPYKQVYDEGGELIGLRYADGTFEAVDGEPFMQPGDWNVEGEIDKFKMSIEEIGTFMVYIKPKYQLYRWFSILNDLCSGVLEAKEYYEIEDCIQLKNLYQQALNEEQQAYEELEDGVTQEDAKEIFNKLRTYRFWFDIIVGSSFWPYGLYCAFTTTGEVCSHLNAYIEATEKVDIYIGKFGKRVIIEDLLYELACPGNDSNNEVTFDINYNPIEIYSNFAVSCNPIGATGDNLTWTWEIPYFWNDSLTTDEQDWIWWTVPGYECTFTIYCTINDGINEYSGSLEVEVVNTHEDDTEEIISVIQEFELAMNNLNWEKAKSCCVYESSLYDYVLGWEHYLYPELHLIPDYDVDAISIENICIIRYYPMFFYDDGLEAYVVFTVGGTYDGESITAYKPQKINNSWKLDQW